MADEANKMLARLIEEMLAAARKALQQPENATPWQRATARAVLETHQQVQNAREVHRQTAEARTQARATVRRARADRGHFGPPAADPLSKLRQAVGRPSARDRQALEAQEAVAQAKRDAERAKKAREQAKQEHEADERAAEKARAQFAEAFGLEVPRFDAKPEPHTTPAPSTEHRPTLGHTPAPAGRRPRPRP